MEAGKLRHRVTIQQATDGRDAVGGATLTWSTFQANFPVAIIPRSGREAEFGGRVSANVSHRIEGRYITGVTPKMRIVKGDRVFNIESILNVDERNREMHFYCKEVTDG